MSQKRLFLLSCTTCLVSHLLTLSALAQASLPAGANGSLPAAPKRPQLEGQHAESIIVTGGGVGTQPGGGLIKRQTETASISTISSDYIAKQTALSNPYTLIEALPGASTSSSDPYGVQTPNLSIRGLDSTEIGFLWEGMPLNDVGNYLGYPDEWFATEDLSEISLRQGSAGISDPLMNNSGGVISMSFLRPTEKAGAFADYSYGSYHTQREFVRLNTGLIGNSGIAAWVSFYNLYAPDWRGSGLTKKQHVDFDAVKTFANSSTISIKGSFNHEDQTFATLPSLADWKEYGRSYNYDGTYTNGDTNYWKLYQAPYTHFFISAPSHLIVNDALSFDVTPYFWYGQGLGSGGTVLNETGNYLGTELVQSPLNVRTGLLGDGTFAAFGTFGNDQYRPGVVTKLNYHVGHNVLVAGYWYDYSSDADSERFEALGDNGLPTNNTGDKYNLRFADGRELFAQSILTKTETNGLFVADTLKFFDNRLVLNAGFKEVMVSRYGTNELPGPQYRSNLNDSAPLPTLGASFQLDPDNQLFASVATHFRTPVNLALYNDYSPSGPYGVKATDLKHEYTISEEIGYRYSGHGLIGSLTFFNYNFSNRQLSSVVIQNGVQVSSYINAGGQTTRGVDAELGTRPYHHVSPYISGEYLDSRIDNNILSGSDYLPSAGKRSVESPPFQLAAGLSYDDTKLFWDVQFKYKAYQYSTFMNDERIPGYPAANMSIGYRLHNLVPVVHPEVKLNLINIGDVKYLSGVSTPTTNAQATRGVFGTTISGSPPLYYVGGGFAAVITLTASL